MPASTRTTTVSKPRDVAWSFLADLRNDVAWRQEISSVVLLNGVPTLAPATYREIVVWGDLRATVILKVVESVPGKRLVVINEDRDYTSRSVWTFEPHGSGTLLMLAFSFETRGLAVHAEPFIWHTLDGWLERDLPLLERHMADLDDRVSATTK